MNCKRRDLQALPREVLAKFFVVGADQEDKNKKRRDAYALQKDELNKERRDKQKQQKDELNRQRREKYAKDKYGKEELKRLLWDQKQKEGQEDQRGVKDLGSREDSSKAF